MQNIWSRTFLGFKFRFFKPMFKIFVALFRTFEINNGDKITFSGGVSEKGDMQKKAVSKGGC